MSKPVVHYSGEALPFMGMALLVPIDHPITRHNGHEVHTSRVMSWSKTIGVIETENTVYVRELVPTPEPEPAGSHDAL